MFTTLLLLQEFTRCDTKSALKVIGKVIKPIKILQKHSKLQSVFEKLGGQWIVPVELFRDLEDFKCSM